MSILLTIYDDLEAMTVTCLGRSNISVTPKAYNLDELPGNVTTAHLPCRLLLPLGQGQGGTPNGEILAGAGIRCNWQITDLFLLEAAAQDMGIATQAPVLMRYVVAYAEALSKKYEFIHGYATFNATLSVNITPGMYEYPAGSNSWFYGVKADITIEETF